MEPVRIECQGATTVPLADLHDLQGNLKDLTEENYVKMRNSIIEFGFSFPVFLWIDQEGTKWILDAHQRIRTLRKMQSEGITIPDLPADIINAKDKIEAKKKLLLLQSRYGKITREGYDEFIDDPDSQIIEEDIADYLVIPEVQAWDAPTQNAQGGGGNEVESDPTKVREITCPSCSHKFTLFGNES